MDAKDKALTVLAHVHGQVDARAAVLAKHHAARLQCRKGCSGCCVDELTVFEVEAERIRRAYPELLEKGTPHPTGACAFLDEEGGCRIYEARPYVCRTQGLPLRWIEEKNDRAAELRDICPLNEPGPSLESLQPGECFTLGTVEEALATLQTAIDGGEGRRVRLRDLFAAR